MTRAYLTLNHGPSTRLGTIRLVVASDTVPRTARNFLTLLRRHRDQRGSTTAPTDDGAEGYLNSTFHRIIPNFMAQGGDFTDHDGTGGTSIYGPSFPDENFVLGHDVRGTLSMANSGPDTNGSQFFITFRETPHLDGRHVVFGRVDLSDGESCRVLDMLERVKTGRDDRPVVPVTVVDCGVEGEERGAEDEAAAAAAVRGRGEGAAAADDDEIDLDDDDDDDDRDAEGGPVAPQRAAAAAGKPGGEARPDGPVQEDGEGEEEAEDEAVVDDDGPPPKNAKEALKARLRRLKLRMNQSRRLNRREVQSEGERLGTEEGAARERRRQAREDRDRRAKEWDEMNGKTAAAGMGAAADAPDARKLTEQASDALRKAQRKADKAHANRFGVDDHYNPEGQHRNYERSLRTVPRGLASSSSAAAADVYDPTDLLDSSGAAAANGSSSERAGAKRLSAELKRRAARTEERRKRKAVEFEASDVSYIDQRNKRFNEKIGRTFDAHTAEIRQNLERGTAL